MLILYGGTFDPFHNGHLAVARSARDAFAAEVRLLVAGDPPHRAPTGASAADRADLVEAGIAGETGLVVDRRELGRRGPSYSIDTVLEVRAELGEAAPLAWLLGADAFLGLPHWHRWESLLGLVHWIVALRPDQVPAFTSGAIGAAMPAPFERACRGRWTRDPGMLATRPSGLVHALALAPRPESASAVRAAIEAGGAWADTVPEGVAAAIRARGLYGVRPGHP